MVSDSSIFILPDGKFTAVLRGVKTREVFRHFVHIRIDRGMMLIPNKFTLEYI